MLKYISSINLKIYIRKFVSNVRTWNLGSNMKIFSLIKAFIFLKFPELLSEIHEKTLPGIFAKNCKSTVLLQTCNKNIKLSTLARLYSVQIKILVNIRNCATKLTFWRKHDFRRKLISFEKMLSCKDANQVVYKAQLSFYWYYLHQSWSVTKIFESWSCLKGFYFRVHLRVIMS